MDRDAIKSWISESIATKQKLIEDCIGVVEDICKVCCDSVAAGGTIFFCGNGGSYSDALHIVGELIGRFHYDRPGIPAITLGTNNASLTAIGNDYGYEQIFSREVDALAKKGDVVIGLTTSGGSKNIVRAFEAAKKKEASCIAFTGSKTDTAVDKICEIVLHVPSDSTPFIQESHISVGHIIATALEKSAFPKD